MAQFVAINIATPANLRGINQCGTLAVGLIMVCLDAFPPLTLLSHPCPQSHHSWVQCWG